MDGRSGAAIVFAVLYLLSSVVPAAAQGSGVQTLLFSGADLWGHGTFLYGGALWSPEGLDHEGFTLKALISGGTYNYISDGLGGATVDGRELVAQLLPGWRFKRGATELELFAGIDLQDHHLSPDDPGSKLRGSDAGVRAAFEFWAEPAADMMIAIDGSASTIAGSYNIHAAAGWRFANRFYVGPELQAFASDDYQQRRIGAHVTAFKVGATEWSAAAGYASDSDDRTSAYARFSVSRRY
jgi:hypothetical protein